MPDFTTRVPALSILSGLGTQTGTDFLQELYGWVIENVQQEMISTRLKNQELSGLASAGSLEAKRFVNAVSQTYGTARGKHMGEKVEAKPVVVRLDVDREIVEEIEQKDIMLYGVSGLLARRAANHIQTIRRELERVFFQTGVDNGATIATVAGENIEDLMERMIQQLETTKNQFVDGVPRDMLHITASPKFYGQLRNYLDNGVNNAHILTNGENINRFHGVEIEPSVYLPAGTRALIQVRGSVAQPVLPRTYAAERIPLSEAWAVSLYYNYGTAVVTPDLIASLAE